MQFIHGTSDEQVKRHLRLNEHWTLKEILEYANRVEEFAGEVHTQNKRIAADSSSERTIRFSTQKRIYAELPSKTATRA